MKQFEICIESRGENESIPEILRKARDSKADLLCLGAFGRKDRQFGQADPTPTTVSDDALLRS